MSEGARRTLLAIASEHAQTYAHTQGTFMDLFRGLFNPVTLSWVSVLTLGLVSTWSYTQLTESSDSPSISTSLSIEKMNPKPSMDGASSLKMEESQEEESAQENVPTDHLDDPSKVQERFGYRVIDDVKEALQEPISDKESAENLKTTERLQKLDSLKGDLSAKRPLKKRRNQRRSAKKRAGTKNRKLKRLPKRSAAPRGQVKSALKAPKKTKKAKPTSASSKERRKDSTKSALDRPTVNQPQSELSTAELEGASSADYMKTRRETSRSSERTKRTSAEDTSPALRRSKSKKMKTYKGGAAKDRRADRDRRRMPPSSPSTRSSSTPAATPPPPPPPPVPSQPAPEDDSTSSVVKTVGVGGRSPSNSSASNPSASPWSTASRTYRQRDAQSALPLLLRWIEQNPDHDRYLEALNLGKRWAREANSRRYLSLFTALERGARQRGGEGKNSGKASKARHSFDESQLGY